MDRKQLLKLLDGTEWTEFECKESKHSLPRDIWKTVSAFSNTSGGHIVLGVKQKGSKFNITGVDNPDKIQNDFVSTLRGEKFNIELATTGYIHKTNQGIVLVFKIEEMTRQAVKKDTRPFKKKEPIWDQVVTKLGLSSKDIKTLLNEGLIQLTIPAKPNSPNQKYIVTQDVKNNILLENENKNSIRQSLISHQARTKLSPSRDQAVTKLGLSPEKIKVILEFCIEEKNISEIMKKMKTRNRNKFINPLLLENLIQMTIPNKPNSPNQRYVTTDKGKELLSSEGK